MKRVLLACVFLLFFQLSAFALDECVVPLSFKPVEGAGGYRIEVRDEKGQIIISREQPETSLKLRLYPSRYSVRVTTINRFGQGEASTAWKALSVPAHESPVFVSLEPQILTWGALKPLELIGQQMAGDLKVELADRQGHRYTLGGLAKDRDSWKLELPPGIDPGVFDLILTNPGSPETLSSNRFIIAVTQPIVSELTPARFTSDRAPESLVLTGSRFFEGMEAVLSNGTFKRELGLLSRKFDRVIIVWPQDAPPGDYSLTVFNGPTDQPCKMSLKVDEPLRPVIVCADKVRLWNNELPQTFILKGSDFSKKAEVWMVKDADFMTPGGKVQLEVEFVDSTALEVKLAPQMHPLPWGDWRFQMRNEPDRPMINGPKIRVAEDPISRPLRFSAGFSPALAVGAWSSIYSFTLNGADTDVAWYFTDHKRPIEGLVCDFGAQTAIDFVFFPKSWNDAKVSSSLMSVSWMAGPVVDLTWPDYAVRAHLGFGAVFTSLEMISDNITEQKLADQEIMPMAGAGLSVEVPLTDMFRTEVGIDWNHYFFIQPLDMLRLNLKAAAALPTH